MAFERVEHEANPAELARQQFFLGIRAMSQDFDRIAQNFGWCAAQIAGDNDAPTIMSGMMEFALRYQEFGLETALGAIEESSGVEVGIRVKRYSEGPDETRSGLIVGLIGASQRKKQQVFSGIAVIENSRSQQAFVEVDINSRGDIFLAPSGTQPKYPETRRLMRDLFPQIKE